MRRRHFITLILSKAVTGTSFLPRISGRKEGVIEATKCPRCGGRMIGEVRENRA